MRGARERSTLVCLSVGPPSVHTWHVSYSTDIGQMEGGGPETTGMRDYKRSALPGGGGAPGSRGNGGAVTNQGSRRRQAPDVSRGRVVDPEDLPGAARSFTVFLSSPSSFFKH